MFTKLELSQEHFHNELFACLGNEWERAVELFTNYGARYSYDFATTLRHAADQGKVKEVLDVLEHHYNEHLFHKNPLHHHDLPQVGDPTEELFDDIAVLTLGLQGVST